MTPLSLREIAELTGGVVHDADPELVVSGAAFLDSRDAVPDGLFAAFEGEHTDGHRFAGQAVGGGAAAVLGSRPTGVPTVVVADVQAALQRLARAVLARRREQAGPLTVVAITGSQGKTSAKDMLEHVLADGAPTVATYGSFNNELGLPLTVLRVDERTRYLVLEMGARGLGHLAELCAIAPPDVSLVLNVGKAHLGEFGSRENIALAKGELVAALAPDGAAVLNADDPLVLEMASRTHAEVWTFGAAAGARVRLSGLVLDELDRPSFDLTCAGATERVDLGLLGAHQAGNAAAVAATALAAGRPLDRVAAALREITSLSRWRMELAERADGLVVINDAYNANPDSMRSALHTLADIGRRSGRRTFAVLGEMRELGDHAEAEHRAVGELTRELGIDHVVVVGEGARALADGNDTARYHETVAAAVEDVGNNVVGTDLVLVKASRAAGFEQVAAALLQDTVHHRVQDPDGAERGTRA